MVIPIQEKQQLNTMEPLNKNRFYNSISYIYVALLLLVVALFFGFTASLHYIFPGLLTPYFSFEKIRPLHVSSAIFWIITASMGSVFSYLQQHTGKKIYSTRLAQIQFYIFLFTFAFILISYCIGIFGGREYWEFHPIFACPIIIGWILFIINFYKSCSIFKPQPVFVWMWLTGIIFFLFTYLESYLWVFPYFGNNLVNDMTIQWKSYGSMVGAWNMLIYGSSLFLMEKISKDKALGQSRIAFGMYFIGLLNMLFNWGHHLYTLPTHGYIKHIGYLVSMTELLILGKIILTWKSTLINAVKHFNNVSYRFILAADVWIFLTLLLAIMMSVPAINIYTHGTHITVAHTMGATIGINSFLLLAIAFDIVNVEQPKVKNANLGFNRSYWCLNISLFIFWMSLIFAGLYKAKWQMNLDRMPFNNMMSQLKPFFISFFISGSIIIISLLAIIIPLLNKSLFKVLLKPRDKI
jgi:nitric oxide reductase subunit B